MFGLMKIDEMFDELVWNSYSRWFVEKDNEYEFRITLPGVKKKDVKVYVKNFQLYVETKSKSFSTSLPLDADPEKVTAKLDLGLLTVLVERTAKKLIVIE